MAIFCFLIWTFLSILLTFNVFFHLAKKSNSSLNFILSTFILSLLVGDLLPQWIILNLGILTFFLFTDIFHTPIGIIGILCHVLSWTILLIRLWIIFNMTDRVNIKMIESFGNYWQKIAKKYPYPEKIFDIDWYSWFNPLNSINDPRIEILENQVYYNEQGIQLKLDIYRPRNIKKNRPGILQIHGGAWITGSKKQASFFLVRMALKGWVCFSVTHRFSPKIIFPEHLIDIKRALSWIRENAEKHGLDKNFIISKGGSSGGHLATMMALTQNNSEFQPSFRKADTSLQGCVSLYGVYNFLDPFNKKTPYPAKSKILKIVCGGSPNTKPDIYKKIIPAKWINENIPPLLIIHGEKDSLISFDESKKFWEVLKSKNIDFSTFLRLPLVEHGFDVFPTLTAQIIVPVIENYMVMIHKNYIEKKKKNETYSKF